MNKSHDNTNFMVKRGAFSFIWVIILLFYFSSFSSTNFLTSFYSILVIIPIRFLGSKKHEATDIKTMFIRIRNCREKYKTRTIISGVLFLFFFIFSLVNIIDNVKKHKAEIIKQEAYNNAPTPIIEILSKSGNIGDFTGYNLIYKTTNSTKVIIGNHVFSGNDKENSVNFSLNGTGETGLNILIIAKNEYKSTEMNIFITRNKTPQEIKMENEEKERIANEQAQGEINILDGYIKELKEGYNFYDVTTISTTAHRLEALWGLIKTDLDNQNARIVQKAKEAKAQLISTQKSIFPKLRAERCNLTKNTMWEYDIDVKCYGGTINFIGGTFASNRNIQDSYLAISDILHLLRFKKASFYRYEGSDYTYYTIDSPSDGTLK